MAKNNTKSKKGFTIIEVVLVLAIAGLIFLMVFVALPSLQRSQRDTQRRSDMARLATAIANWQANHDNNLPSTAANATSLLNDYLRQGDGEFTDPDRGNYTLTITAASSSNISNRPTANTSAIMMFTGAQCTDGAPAVKANSPRSYAIIYQLEGSGLYCLDNS